MNCYTVYDGRKDYTTIIAWSIVSAADQYVTSVPYDVQQVYVKPHGSRVTYCVDVVNHCPLTYLVLIGGGGMIRRCELRAYTPDRAVEEAVRTTEDILPPGHYTVSVFHGGKKINSITMEVTL